MCTICLLGMGFFIADRPLFAHIHGNGCSLYKTTSWKNPTSINVDYFTGWYPAGPLVQRLENTFWLSAIERSSDPCWHISITRHTPHIWHLCDDMDFLINLESYP